MLSFRHCEVSQWLIKQAVTYAGLELEMYV